MPAAGSVIFALVTCVFPCKTGGPAKPLTTPQPLLNRFGKYGSVTEPSEAQPAEDNESSSTWEILDTSPDEEETDQTDQKCTKKGERSRSILSQMLSTSKPSEVPIALEPGQTSTVHPQDDLSKLLDSVDDGNDSQFP